MNWFEGILRDLRYTVRSLVRDPIFTIVSVLTLSLAIGATTAIYTAFKTVLLDPLPFNESDRLVMLWEKKPDSEPQQCGLATIEAWKEQNNVFESICHIANVSAPYDRTKWSQGNVRNFLVSLGETEVRLRGRHVSSNFFEVMRVAPNQGRPFLSDDDLPGSEPVAVVSHSYWQRIYNGDTDILEKTVNVMDKYGRDHKPYRIVGVLPPSVRFPPDAELWLSYSGLSEQDRTSFAPTSWAIGRLKDGVSLDQARREMNLIQRRLLEQTSRVAIRAWRGSRNHPFKTTDHWQRKPDGLAYADDRCAFRTPDCLRQHRRAASSSRFKSTEGSRGSYSPGC